MQSAGCRAAGRGAGAQRAATGPRCRPCLVAPALSPSPLGSKLVQRCSTTAQWYCCHHCVLQVRAGGPQFCAGAGIQLWRQDLQVRAATSCAPSAALSTAARYSCTEEPKLARGCGSPPVQGRGVGLSGSVQELGQEPLCPRAGQRGWVQELHGASPAFAHEVSEACAALHAERGSRAARQGAAKAARSSQTAPTARRTRVTCNCTLCRRVFARFACCACARSYGNDLGYIKVLSKSAFKTAQDKVLIPWASMPSMPASAAWRGALLKQEGRREGRSSGHKRGRCTARLVGAP